MSASGQNDVTPAGILHVILCYKESNDFLPFIKTLTQVISIACKQSPLATQSLSPDSNLQPACLSSSLTIRMRVTRMSSPPTIRLQMSLSRIRHRYWPSSKRIRITGIWLVYVFRSLTPFQCSNITRLTRRQPTYTYNFQHRQYCH